jgi:hypothetical protein
VVTVTEHPSAEQLADLAADELPADFGAVVETHVFECQQCYDLLAEAETMGQVLRNAPDPVMPDDVWNRLAGALAAAGEVTPAAAAPAPTDDEQWLTQTWPAVPAVGWTPQAPEPQPSPPIVLDDAPTSQWQVFVDEADDEVDARPRRIRAAEAAAAETGPNAPADHVPRGREGSRLGRPTMVVSRLRSRRDVREERRHASLERYGRPLGIAAGVVLAVGLGGVAFRGLAGVGASRSSMSAAGANPEAASGAAAQALEVVSTGTSYTKATITTAALKQAKTTLSLVTAGGGDAPAASASGSHRDAGSAAAAGSLAAATGATEPRKSIGTPSPVPGAATRAATAGDGSDQRLRDPAALQACLKELGVTPGTTPILVDLAKFDGRDAAVIVLAGRDGGYEVWAVARDCRTGAGGQLSYTSVPAS